ncbi:MAG TPA: 5-formyltetrahydrofolate cyclo-ligase [Gammaproteobacteria bacterium]|jgi:5-formyltetrahydrofolate cyclo-ligase|nr:5-formyltetrahydrofolate cyclo-ligase [Gammaproteobacteria bacterium]HAT25698.1 5-formyltetrahydrofolate cyclo-ligase [Gammaproteobacteria bacterium]HIF85996.1 5-formyltetrahydrofolate cyclo-ligase [Gammaproteobacteria bacterium]HIL61940.1 5-formyltetrahydrofolate cyclo-ligase [Porticoccaceae bacterium]|tara:strand:+ start:29477 stop:30073 length:597 start_codon:yes stop_codon:yes gene_type:complete
MTDDNRKALRASLRQSRQQLSPEKRHIAARSLLDLIGHQDFFRVAQRIAFYQVIDGEIDPQLLLDLALSEGKACFLPVLSRENPEFVSFAAYDADTPLVENQWGIAEPSPETIVSPTNFDVVFVPLVGFNEQCFRMGMGKGFYDRTFSFKIFNRCSRPLLVGLAHESQLVKEAFPVESWDVRLDAIATDKKIYRPDTA